MGCIVKEGRRGGEGSFSAVVEECAARQLAAATAQSQRGGRDVGACVSGVQANTHCRGRERGCRLGTASCLADGGDESACWQQEKGANLYSSEELSTGRAGGGRDGWSDCGAMLGELGGGERMLLDGGPFGAEGLPALELANDGAVTW